MKNTDALRKIGQSLWYDNIQRSMLQNGEIAGMIARGEIQGMTSNPSIFQNAIVKTTDYDIQVQTLAWAGVSAETIFWDIAIDDVQKAADLFRDVYRSTGKRDGYVSLEVNPNYAYDTKATISAAVDLWKKVNRPNLMVKVPATKEGIPAIRELTKLGINVNVTLIFSRERYIEVAEAYISGLEERVASGNPIDQVHSVASFFVSRVDSKIDPLLDQVGTSSKMSENLTSMKGKAAIYNSRLAYKEFTNRFGQKRFTALLNKGANLQRPLWASTSTKNPAYPDVMYVEELVGKNTVNTIPPTTLTAFLDHGKVKETICDDLAMIDPFFKKLAELGINIDEVTDTLEQEGVKAFIDAYNSLLSAIEARSTFEVSRLCSLAPKVKTRLDILRNENFVTRLWNHDPTLWTDQPDGQKEIVQRMDWLLAPWEYESVKSQTHGLLQQLTQEGITHAVILGMGGSSLAPEVFSKILAAQNENATGLRVSILDSTHPDEVNLAAKNNPVEHTVFLVSSKSGTTGEINAFFNYFYEIARNALGNKAGSHFIAITDPGTRLEQVAKEKHFRKVITANPRVGGRNSALTAFGLVPAILAGIDVDRLLATIQYYGDWFKCADNFENNPGVVLGAIIGEAALAEKNKITIIADDEWNNLAAWMEQLIAESSGKDGKGILPVASEPILSPSKYGNDRIFIYLRKTGTLDKLISPLIENNHPVVQLNVNSVYDLGYQFYLWEIATATACSIIGVNSFDQPDVQDAKTRTLAGIDAYKKTGQFMTDAPKYQTDFFSIYTSQDIEIGNAASLKEIVTQFLDRNLIRGGYVAVNGFIPRIETNIVHLTSLRKQILENFETSTTLGFGPRYLHSTGQLHKGGPDNGVFIIITNTPESDMQIPGEGITFGKFCMAQALGDEAALAAHGRSILRIHFTGSEINIY